LLIITKAVHSHYRR